MSKKKIDWDKILGKDKPTIEEVENLKKEYKPITETKEELYIKLERMKNSNRYTRFNYYGVVLACILFIAEVGMAYALEVAGVPFYYMVPIELFVILSAVVYGHYISLIVSMRKLSLGEN